MKLKKRVFLTTTLILFITTFITGMLFSFLFYQYSENLFKENALNLTKNIASDIVQIYHKYYENSFSAFSKNILYLLSDIKDIKNFFIVDMNGKILFSYDEINSKQKYQKEDRLIDEDLLSKVHYNFSTYLKIYKDRNVELLIIQPVFDFYQRHLYSIIFYYSLNSLIRQSFYLISLSLAIFIILMILNYFFSSKFASYLTKPLEIILESVKKSREEEYKSKINFNSDYEFNILALELNRMM
ncbi:MAG: hypothetical protein WH035_07600, partial [Spirochaetota bacterium]